MRCGCILSLYLIAVILENYYIKILIQSKSDLFRNGIAQYPSEKA
jgi:hypothetical protein